jgi:hypothetical protein
MPLLFYTLLIAMVVPCWAHVEELIPGVIAFDPPEFLSALPSNGYGTNFEDGVQIVRRYAATDNNPRISQRLLIISLRKIGANPNAEKMTANAQPDDKAMAATMQTLVNSTRNAINVTAVTNAEVGGKAAWLVSYQIPRPYWQKPAGELFPYEVYWVKVNTNQVAEIKLIANSSEHLQTLQTCLPRFKLTPPDPSAATGTTDLTH